LKVFAIAYSKATAGSSLTSAQLAIALATSAEKTLT